MPRLRKWLVRGVLVSVVVLGTGVGMLYALQRQLIYFPDATTVPPAADVIPGSRDVTLHTEDGLELGAWFVPATGSEDTGMAVLFAPGNGGNREGRAMFAAGAERARVRRTADGLPRVRREPGQSERGGSRRRCERRCGGAGRARLPRGTARSTSGSPWAPVWCRRCRRSDHRRAWSCGPRSRAWPTSGRTTTRGCRCAR